MSRKVSSLLVVPCVLAVTAAAQTPVIYGIGRRPSHFCPDNRTCVSHMVWRMWSSTTAVGAGRMQTCAPGATCRSGTQTITYTRPRNECGHLTYTRFRYYQQPIGPFVGYLADCQWYYVIGSESLPPGV